MDSYENTAADYAEIPELADDFFEKATVHWNGQPVRKAELQKEPPKKSATQQVRGRKKRNVGN